MNSRISGHFPGPIAPFSPPGERIALVTARALCALHNSLRCRLVSPRAHWIERTYRRRNASYGALAARGIVRGYSARAQIPSSILPSILGWLKRATRVPCSARQRRAGPTRLLRMPRANMTSGGRSGSAEFAASANAPGTMPRQRQTMTAKAGFHAVELTVLAMAAPIRQSALGLDGVGMDDRLALQAAVFS